MEELNHTSGSSESAEEAIETPNTAETSQSAQPNPSSPPLEETPVEEDASSEEETSEESVSEEDASEEDASEEDASEEDISEEGAPAEAGSWEEQLEESLASSTLKRGELREGIILDRRNDGFVVDIGAKRDGFVPQDDLKELEEEREFHIGDEIAVVVTQFRDSDGNVELSISQALLQEDWLRAEKLLESQDVVETTVTGYNRGGLTVEFGRLRGFVPMSQLIGFNRIRQPAERQRRLESMVDEEIMLKVIEVNRRRRRLILSQRAAAREWRSARRENLLDDLEAGQVRRGRISQITDFGLFVNLGGMDGLVHISELSWGRIENPGEIYHPGQRVKVKVLNVDRERQRIALSIKALTPDPWESVAERYQVGDLVEGRVTQVVDFGVFIELEPGVEGLLHNSELRDVAQREELSAGDSILVKVIRVEPDRRRIGLSVRQVRPNEWEEWALAQLREEEAEQAAQAEQAEEAEAATVVEEAATTEDEIAEEAEAEEAEAVEA
ncbi:MAG: 30S ribosomal protein S1, partial [Anaerolineae bacterium]